MTIEVADDFVDKNTIGDRLIWLGNAVFRAAVALLVALLFFTGLAALELRYDAESALGNGQQANAPQPELHRLLEAPRVQGAAALGEGNMRAQAEAAYDARINLDRAVAQQGEQQTRVAEAERRLISAAELANCGVNPTIAASQACTGAGAAESLVANLADAKTGYDEALNASVQAGVQVRAMQVNLDTALRAGEEQASSGAPLAAAVPVLREFDGLQSYMPAPAQPLVASLFSMDTEISILVVAFVAGLLGATGLLFILITFPNYLPLTFGSGKHFFLRMFTGGAVAVLVVLVFRLGAMAQGAPQELAQAQALLAQSNLSEPVRYALIGVVAGFFAEQIAKWAKDYAEAAFHGVRTTAPTAASGETYATPPEGGPRPAQ